MIQRIWRGLFILPIRFYQWGLRPFFPSKCAYHPTCSRYMVAAILEWGVAKGVWMGLKRIGRCHPWGGFGYDPVPENPDNQNTDFLEKYFLKKN